jgi:hypothetical protein
MHATLPAERGLDLRVIQDCRGRGDLARIRWAATQVGPLPQSDRLVARSSGARGKTAGAPTAVMKRNHMSANWVFGVTSLPSPPGTPRVRT